MPTLGAALSLPLFFPGFIAQGSDTHLAATGLTQEPYAARWALLTASLFVISALVYGTTKTRSRIAGSPPPNPGHR